MVWVDRLGSDRFGTMPWVEAAVGDVRREHCHHQLGGRGGGHGDGDGRGVPAVNEREVTTTKDPATTTGDRQEEQRQFG